MNQRNNEQGFILISVIVLTLILSILAVVATNKSQVEIKVSAAQANNAKADAIAKAGLAKNYAAWRFNIPVGGTAEFTAVRDAVDTGTATAGNYIAALSPNSTTQLTTMAGGNVDTYIQNSGAVNVFSSTAGGALTQVNNNLWNTGTNLQVAVWTASFTKVSDPTYPYNTPNTGSCTDCAIATYALGRSGTSRSLQREIQSNTTRKIGNVSAITNAPQTAYWGDLCRGSTGTNLTNVYGSIQHDGPATVPATTSTVQSDWMIEATQAEYQIFAHPSTPKNYNIPSGVAFASNTAAGVGNTEFEVEFPLLNGENTSPVAVYDTDPNIMYSGHQTTSDVRVYRASQTRDTTTPGALNLDTIGAKLPYRLVNDRLLATTGQLDLINSSGQVFDLDALRWGAEQFTCRTVGSNSNASPNGKYCSKAEALRQAVHTGRSVRNNGRAVTNDSRAAPVTGRMTFAEFQYNVANAVPMFGMIRVMYPAIADTSTSGSGTCNGVLVQLYKTEDASEKIRWSTGASDYDGSPAQRDTDGDLGPKAKLIVYGSITIDFFADTNANFRFDAAAGEHILTTFENGEAKAEMNVPELVNPALPFAADGSLGAFPVSGGTITTGTSGKPVNLASPTGGWFPASEGLIPDTAGALAKSNGKMELMNITGVGGTSKLLDIGNRIGSTGGTATANTHFTTYKTRLEYYYDLMKAVADHGDPNQWPIANFPSSMSNDFCIGNDDCNVTGPNHNGDKVHLLFPSGYMHGWKVALTALGMKATEWNSMLTGIDTLANVATTNSTVARKGSAFNSLLDPGVAKARDTSALTGLIPNQKLYYFTDAGESDYPLLTSKWADIPTFVYSGGNMQVQHTSNISGVTYTPESMAWGAEDDLNTDLGTGYFNGAMITGFGFAKGSEHGVGAGGNYSVVVFDPQSVDNAVTENIQTRFIRYAWEQL